MLSEDYLADPSSLGKLREQLVVVASRMADTPDLAGMLDRGETDTLVERLLEGYYDPLYRRSEEGKIYRDSIDAESAEGAACSVVEWVEGRLGASPASR